MAYPSLTTFIVIPTPNVLGLDETIRQKFGTAAYRLPLGEWLVAYQGTSKQLSDELQISDSKTASAVVLSVSSYWGRTNPDVWEWLKQHSG